QESTVWWWARTGRMRSREIAQCELDDPSNMDNHIVLIDLRIKHPTLAKDERHSVTAEFTLRVRLPDHPNFTRDELNPLIDASWKKPSKRNPMGKLLLRVTGLLLFDTGHLPPHSLKRDTNWEIHPVLTLEFCPKEKPYRL